MGILIKVRANGQKDDFWVPDGYILDKLQERAEKIVKDYEARQRDRTAITEDTDRALKDTKPDFYINDSVPGRRIIAVGAGTAYREDLKDLSYRVLEKEDPRKRLSRRENIANDIDHYAWLSKRLPINKTSFQISQKWTGIKKETNNE